MFSNNTHKNYLFSKDFAEIFWKINKKVNANCIINLASDYNFSLINLCLEIKNLLPNIIIVNESQNITYDTFPPVIHNQKLKSLIHVKFTPIQEAIKETLEWEKANLK